MLVVWRDDDDDDHKVGKPTFFHNIRSWTTRLLASCIWFNKFYLNRYHSLCVRLLIKQLWRIFALEIRTKMSLFPLGFHSVEQLVWSSFMYLKLDQSAFTRRLTGFLWWLSWEHLHIMILRSVIWVLQFVWICHSARVVKYDNNRPSDWLISVLQSEIQLGTLHEKILKRAKNLKVS